MYFSLEPDHLMKVKEMAEQIDALFTELRMEYLDMAKQYDEALQRIEKLEADAIFWEEYGNGENIY